MTKECKLVIYLAKYQSITVSNVFIIKQFKSEIELIHIIFAHLCANLTLKRTTLIALRLTVNFCEITALKTGWKTKPEKKLKSCAHMSRFYPQATEWQTKGFQKYSFILLIH